MLERFKRKLSRSKSVGNTLESDYADSGHKSSLTLSPSDEQLINKLKFADDTNLEDKPPRRLNPSIYSHGSVATTSSERTIFNNVDKGILSLPTEVLLTLQKYITPSSEVALRHACARFLHLFTLPSFYLSGDDKFEWLCLYEKDQDPDELDQLVCGLCKERHVKATFPAAERKLSPAERDCRQVWLCPHKHLGYQKTLKDIKAGHEAPFKSQSLESCSRCREVIRSRSVAERPEKGTAATDLDSPNAASLLITKIALLQAPAPKYKDRTSSGGTMYKEVFAVKDVAAALCAIDLPVCNHLRLSDQYLLSRFCRSCINTQRLPPNVRGPPCISEQKRDVGDPEYLGKCKQSCYTRGCKTKFMFQSRESLSPDASGRRQIWLILAIYRWLGPLQSENRDGHWLGHSVPHLARTEMRQKWEASEKARGNRKPMPNWSICLLHPEDPSVRTTQVFVPYQPNSASVEDALKGVITNMRK
ncbi:hypothetical protein LTS08_002926 [Lithohypha guttulata]|nr:hypothetical protein LTS08_002926 [Lithohypha guttulata]